ncbi:hypothetical protein FRB99_004127, partial [Tulasnella sp. 403]
IDTLGGAGFASQRYAFDPPLNLDYTRFSGIRIEVVPCSEGGAREFTMTIATTPSESTPDGKPASRVSWEASFSIPSGNAKDVRLVELPFGAFVPTYRGRKVEGKPEFATRTTYEVGVMCRSGFGKQKGKFGVGIRRVEVVERGWGGRIARLIGDDFLPLPYHLSHYPFAPSQSQRINKIHLQLTQDLIPRSQHARTPIHDPILQLYVILAYEIHHAGVFRSRLNPDMGDIEFDCVLEEA